MIKKTTLLTIVALIFFALITSCEAQIVPPTKTPPEPLLEIERKPQEYFFFSEPREIISGECAILRWEIAPEFFVSLDGEPVENAGERQVCPEITSTFLLVFEDGENSYELTTTVTINEMHHEEGIIIEMPVELPSIEPATPAYEFTQWVATGGPPGGLGYDIRMDPRNPDVMYVTDAQTGVFKSLDGGENWFPINEGITTRTGYSGTAIPVFSLTIDPNQPDTIWAGTQFSSGVFRSDDAGQTWQAMNTGSNGIIEKQISIRGLTIEPGNSDVVYFAGEVSSWEWLGEPKNGIAMDLTKGVVYKTVDGGRNWRRIWYGDNLARYIWVNPNDTNRLYVSTGIFDREAANSNAETKSPGGVGILRSMNGGETWEILAEQHGILPKEYYFGSLYMHPEDPDILIAAAGNDPYLMLLGDIGAIYLTKNGGDQWQRVLELRNASVVEICDTNPEVVYAGSIAGIYRSMDGGQNWTQTSGALWGSPDVLAGFPIDMQCDPRDPMRIFINNYIGGNFLSEDGGENWKVMSKGYTGAMQRQVTNAYGNPDIVCTAGRMGVFSSIDGGLNWLGTAHGPARVPEAIVIAVSPFNPDIIMAVFQDGGPDPKLSTDGGETWENILTGLWEPGMFTENEYVTRVLFSKFDSNLVLASVGSHACYTFRVACEESPGLGIIRSMDGGRIWNKTNLSQGHVMDLEIINEKSILAAVYPAKIFHSEDGGIHWELIAEDISETIPGTFIDLNFEKPYILSVAVDSLRLDRIYAGFERGGIMVSDDYGQTWQHYSAGMPPETTIMDIEVDPIHPGIVYLATINSGVFYKLADSDLWLTLNDGLTIRTAMDLSLSRDGGVLYLATDGGGVFRLGPNQVE